METRGQEGDIVWMQTLAACSNKMKEDGYVEDFKVKKNSLATYDGKKHYKPEQVHIVNYYRFEGASDPADNSILYVIETDDGVKGTLLDGYGAYSEQEVGKFITAVDDIKKRIPTSKLDA